eukprot:TRINITY_DN14148_c0_g1_i1.p1 TRINITY_DN14148_c0_g1~~TRINITY_DN14148_c0_g1_i1.p1  ORF type:complete len:625 (-),score=188.79 TRINITY_DN14148_c0_g1_i1:90-1964(-)
MEDDQEIKDGMTCCWCGDHFCDANLGRAMVGCSDELCTACITTLIEASPITKMSTEEFLQMTRRSAELSLSAKANATSHNRRFTTTIRCPKCKLAATLIVALPNSLAVDPPVDDLVNLFKMQFPLLDSQDADQGKQTIATLKVGNTSSQDDLGVSTSLSNVGEKKVKLVSRTVKVAGGKNHPQAVNVDPSMFQPPKKVSPSVQTIARGTRSQAEMKHILEDTTPAKKLPEIPNHATVGTVKSQPPIKGTKPSRENSFAQTMRQAQLDQSQKPNLRVSRDDTDLQLQKTKAKGIKSKRSGSIEEEAPIKTFGGNIAKRPPPIPSRKPVMTDDMKHAAVAPVLDRDSSKKRTTTPPAFEREPSLKKLISSERDSSPKTESEHASAKSSSPKKDEGLPVVKNVDVARRHFEAKRDVTEFKDRVDSSPIQATKVSGSTAAVAKETNSRKPKSSEPLSRFPTEPGQASVDNEEYDIEDEPEVPKRKKSNPPPPKKAKINFASILSCMIFSKEDFEKSMNIKDAMNLSKSKVDISAPVLLSKPNAARNTVHVQDAMNTMLPANKSMLMVDPALGFHKAPPLHNIPSVISPSGVDSNSPAAPTPPANGSNPTTKSPMDERDNWIDPFASVN